MTTYPELNLVSLLDGAADLDGDTVSLHTINGSTPASWPVTVNLPVGSVLVYQTGAVVYDDGGDTSSHPADGVDQANGSLNFTLHDGTDESASTYTASFVLRGTAAGAPPALTGGVMVARWDTSEDMGATGDYFVSPTGNDTTGDGSVGNPYATPQRAVDQAVTDGPAGKVIKIADGVYSPPNTTGAGGTSGNPLLIQRWGTGSPTFIGGTVLTGLTQCTSSRQSVLGTGFANVYEQTVNNTLFSAFGTNNAGLPACAGSSVCEEGVLLDGAVDKRLASRDFFQNDPSSMYTADSFNTSTPGAAVTSITDTSVLSGYTFAELEHAHASIHYGGGGNLVSQVPITGKPSADTISVAGSLGYETSRYCLTNVLKTLTSKPGWGYIDNGDGTSTVFVRPANVANIAAGNITLATEISAFVFGADYIEVEGIKLVQSGGHQWFTNRVVDFNSRTGCVLRKCYVGETDGTRGNDRNSMINMLSTTDCSVVQCKLTRGSNSFGISYDLSLRCRVYQNEISFVGGTAVRQLGSLGSLLAWNDFYWVGWGGHSNLVTLYEAPGTQATDGVIFWGNRFRYSKSYIVTKGCSNLVIAFNDVPCAMLDGENRAISDDNSPTGGHLFDIDASSTLYVVNNSIFPDMNEPTAGGSLGMPNHAVGELPISLRNNIIHGGGVRPSRNRVDFANNFYTHLEWYQSGAEAPGTIDASNAVNTDLNAVYEDAANGNFNAATGSPLLTHSTKAINDMIADMKALSYFTDAEIDNLLTSDIVGNTIDPNNPPIGCYAVMTAAADNVSTVNTVTF